MNKNFIIFTLLGFLFLSATNCVEAESAVVPNEIDESSLFDLEYNPSATIFDDYENEIYSEEELVYYGSEEEEGSNDEYTEGEAINGEDYGLIESESYEDLEAISEVGDPLVFEEDFLGEELVEFGEITEGESIESDWIDGDQDGLIIGAEESIIDEIDVVEEDEPEKFLP